MDSDRATDRHFSVKRITSTRTEPVGEPKRVQAYEENLPYRNEPNGPGVAAIFPYETDNSWTGSVCQGTKYYRRTYGTEDKSPGRRIDRRL